MGSGTSSSGTGGTESSPDQEGERLSSGISSTLSGEPGVPRSGYWTPVCTELTNSLCLMPPPATAAETPQSTQTMELSYSNWGNEAFWR